MSASSTSVTANVGVLNGNFSNNTITGNLKGNRSNCVFVCCSERAPFQPKVPQAAAEAFSHFGAAAPDPFVPVSSNPTPAAVQVAVTVGAGNHNGSGNTIQDNLSGNEGNFTFNCCSGRGNKPKKSVVVLSAAGNQSAAATPAAPASAAAQVTVNVGAGNQNGTGNVIGENGTSNEANCQFICCSS